jgi:hypothetical protein
LLPSDPHDRLRAATDRLRAALADQRAALLPKTADLVQRALDEAEAVLASPQPYSLELELAHAEQVLNIWNSLLSF